MAPPTEPYNTSTNKVPVPLGLSRLTVPSGGSLTVTFQAATGALRLATQGSEIEISWTSAGNAGNAKNSVGGTWTNPWKMVGNVDELVLTDVAGAGDVDVDLAVTPAPLPTEVFPTDKSVYEGATEAHASA